MSFPQRKYGFHLSRYLYAKRIVVYCCCVLEPRLGNNLQPFVSVNASFLSKRGGRSGLFDRSVTGLSDTVAKISATQHVQSRIKACTVNIYVRPKNPREKKPIKI